MNAKIARQYEIVKIYRQLRDDLMVELSDDDLTYSPGGENDSLGVLCRQLGEVQKGYVESFKTFSTAFDYETDDEEMESRADRIRAWYQQLDDELEEVLETLSDEEVDNRLIVRTETFKLPAVIHLDVFREALIIFFGKVSVYLKSMNRTRPTKWDKWLG